MAFKKLTKLMNEVYSANENHTARVSWAEGRYVYRLRSHACMRRAMRRH